MTIKHLKTVIGKSEEMENNGVSFRQQAFVNYVQEVLDLKVIEIVNLGEESSYMDMYEITAASKDESVNLKYKFTGEHFAFQDYSPKENILTLSKVYDDNQEYEVGERFYMRDLNPGSREMRFLTSSIGDLIDGVESDKELEFAVDTLRKLLCDKPGYKYSLKKYGDLSTFEISVGENLEVAIRRAAANTFQVDFYKRKLKSVQVVFRDIVEDEFTAEIKRLGSFIDDYLENEILLNGQNISKLIEGVHEYYGVNTELLINGVPKGVNGREIERVFLFTEFTLGKGGTYQQIEVSIDYDSKLKQFIVKTNYLFNRQEAAVDNVEDVISLIQEIKKLVIVEK